MFKKDIAFILKPKIELDRSANINDNKNDTAQKDVSTLRILWTKKTKLTNHIPNKRDIRSFYASTHSPLRLLKPFEF